MKNAKLLKNSFTAGLVVSLLSACQASNPPLTGPQLKPGKKLEREILDSNTETPIIKLPMVDILFVIDDSASMGKHQKKLSDNIAAFVREFGENNRNEESKVDFHIGLTLAHDSGRYGSVVPAVCPEGTDHAGRINWLPAGSLQPLVGLEDKGRRYVTSQDDFEKILLQSLDPKQNTKTDLVKTLVTPKSGDKTTCGYGPEEEELFTPLLGAIEGKSSVAQSNKGFRRKGAFFVAILLSDAKDNSKIDHQDVFNRIKSAVGENEKGKLNFRIFSVSMKPGDTFRSDCRPDPVWSERITDRDGNAQNSWEKVDNQLVPLQGNPLAQLALLTEDQSLPSGAQVLSICSNDYGDSLAKYGAKVQQDVVKDITIELSSRPEITDDPDKKLRVWLDTDQGSQELTQGVQWDYNAYDATIRVYKKTKTRPEGLDWSALAGARIRPTWTPVDEKSKWAKPAQ